MRIVKLKKKRGGYRTIYMPSDAEKAGLRNMLIVIERTARNSDRHGVSHAFTYGRSPLTNALVHVGWRYTLSMDLADFFDSVKPDNPAFVKYPPLGPPNPFLAQLEERSMVELTACLFPDGAARQGLPTSPALANIAFALADEDIMKLQIKGRFTKPNFAYSRYADDLTLSADHMDMIRTLEYEVPRIVERHGFRINQTKTRIQCAKAGRRIITGIAVGDKNVTLPRYMQRRIRAGEHQLEHGLKRRCIDRLLEARRRWKLSLPLRVRLGIHVNGLKEWAKLKMPKNFERNKPRSVTEHQSAVARTTQKHPSGLQKVGQWFRKFA